MQVGETESIDLKNLVEQHHHDILEIDSVPIEKAL